MTSKTDSYVSDSDYTNLMSPEKDDNYYLVVDYEVSVYAEELPDPEAAYDFTFELPVPEGFKPSTAKYYDDGYKEVTSNTDNSVIIDVKMEASEYPSSVGYKMNFVEGFGLDDGMTHFVVEYEKGDDWKPTRDEVVHETQKGTEPVKLQFDDDSEINEKYPFGYIAFNTDTDDVKLTSVHNLIRPDGTEYSWLYSYVEDSNSPSTTYAYYDDEKDEVIEREVAFPEMDDSYSLRVIYGVSVFADVPEGDVCNFTFEFPVPEGYEPTTAKYYNNGYKEVDSYTDGSIIINVKEKADFSTAAGSLMNPAEDFGLEEGLSGFIVEYQKKEQQNEETYFIYEDGTVAPAGASTAKFVGYVTTSDKSVVSYDKKKNVISLNGGKVSSLYVTSAATVCVSGKASVDKLVVSGKVNATLDLNDDAVLSCGSVELYDGGALILAENVSRTETGKETVFKKGKSEAKKGDANCDGAVNIADATAIIQAIANGDKYGLSEQGAINADCDGKKGVTALDAFVIQQLEAGIIESID